MQIQHITMFIMCDVKDGRCEATRSMKQTQLSREKDKDMG